LEKQEDVMAEEPKRYYFYKCPVCGKYFPITRSYCDCHARLENTVYWSETAVELGVAAYNLETSMVNCKDCGMGCKICASFTVIEQNKQGFGGLDCLWRSGSVRCACCQMLLREDLIGFNPKAVVDKIKAEFKNNMPPAVPEPQRERMWYEDRDDD
jgi:hypothetical protein